MPNPHVAVDFSDSGTAKLTIDLGDAKQAAIILASFPPYVLEQYEADYDVMIEDLAKACEEHEAYRDEVMAGYDESRFGSQINAY